MEKKQRLDYIDAAKAIAIILVIIGHCYWVGAVPRLRNIIYSFHMPLFFVVSGFFIKQLSIKEALTKYSKAYLWPYMVIGTLITVIDVIKTFTNHESWSSSLTIDLTRIVWGSNYESNVLFGNIPHIGASWFLLALFWGCFFFTLLLKLKTRLQQIAVLLLGVSYSLCSAKFLKMPMSLQAGAISVIYLYIGNYIVKNGVLKDVIVVPNYIKAMSVILCLVTAAFFPILDIGSASLGYSIVGLMVSFIGTLSIILICKQYRLKFNWIGRNTLYILCAHIILGPILDILGCSFQYLAFCPQINFIIEVTCSILSALILAWLISKVHVLEFNRIFKRI